jgi:hypothetical protein
MGRASGRKAARRERLGILCIYCNERPGITDDHVPPRSLFPEPRPSDLMTVPCCEQCRVDLCSDDDYFKNTIVMRADVGSDPYATRVLESVHRALERRDAKFARALTQNIRWAEIRTSAGLYLGHAATYPADLVRLGAVVRRTLLGLYYIESKERLPDSHVAEVYDIEALPRLAPEHEALLERLVNAALSGKVRRIGGSVFAYAMVRLLESPTFTVWVFRFYRRVIFVGLTGLRQDMIRS